MSKVTELSKDQLDKMARCERAYKQARAAAGCFQNAQWFREQEHPVEAEVLETEGLAALDRVIRSFDK